MTRKRKNRKRYRILTLMTLPALAYLFINCYLPMPGLYIAFKQINYTKGLWNSPWVGLDNFRYLFSTSDAWLITRNTVLYNVVFIVLRTTLAVAIAILMSEIGGRILSRVYQTSLIAPAMVSTAIVGYCVYGFLSPGYGYMNKILEALGMQRVNWYINADPWPVILAIVHIWKEVGYASIVYLASVVGIDRSYYEAAIVDGASRWNRIRYITIPMIKPTIITMVLLSIGGVFHADFGLFYQVPMGSGALLDTTNVIDTYVFRALMGSGDIGKSAAAGLYQSVVGFILVMISNYITRKISEEHALF